MIGRSYALFLIVTAAWMTAATLAYPIPYGWYVASAAIWWGLLVMTIATGYYVIQVAPEARAVPWLGRDFLVNAALLLVLLFALLDGSMGWRYLSLGTAGWIAFGVAAIHPLAVDLPHRRHHELDPAGSPVPRYLPPACLWIDWTTAGLVLGALALL